MSRVRYGSMVNNIYIVVKETPELSDMSAET